MPDRPGATGDSAQQCAADGGYFASLTPARYMRLTTFKRGGIPVSRTVRGVVNGDQAYFRARTQSGVVKRLRHTDSVQVAPCGALGFFSYGPPLDALARRLADGEASTVAAQLDRKYPVRRRFATRLLRPKTVYYQLAADDVPRDQDGPPGEPATLNIRVHVTRGSVDGNAATPGSLAALCLPAIKPRSYSPDHTRIVTVTVSPSAELPRQPE
jgi:uncharacterized protein